MEIESNINSKTQQRRTKRNTCGIDFHSHSAGRELDNDLSFILC